MKALGFILLGVLNVIGALFILNYAIANINAPNDTQNLVGLVSLAGFPLLAWADYIVLKGTIK